MAEYDVGEAFLRLVPSFSGFVEAVNRQMTDAGVQGARVFGDAFNREAARAVNDVTPTVRLDTTDISAQLARLNDDLDRLSRQSPTVRVVANTGDADARLAATRAAADSLGRSSPTIGVHVDTGPALAAIGTIKTALLGLSAGAAITPLIGGAAALLGPLGAVGAGAAGVGAASAPGLDAVKNAMAAQTKAQDGTAASAKALNAEMAKLTPQEKALLDQTDKLKSTFSGWGKSLEPATLPLFTGGIGLLTQLLPKLEPLIRATAGALGDMEKSLSGAINSGGLTKFLDTLTKLVGPALKDIGAIGGNLAGVFAHVVEAFAPLSGVVLGGLKDLTAELDKASSGAGLGQFVKMLVGLGPIMEQTFGSIGGLVGKLLQALAPLAGPVLSVINTLATALSGVVVAVGPSIAAMFKTLAPAVNSLVAALGPALTGVIKALAPVIGTLGTALSKGLVALTPALVPLAKLIGTLVTALAPLLPVIGKLVGTLLPLWDGLLTQLVKALQPVIAALVGALGPVLPQIAAAFGQLIKALGPVFPLLTKLLLAFIPLIPPLAELVVQFTALAIDLLPLYIVVLTALSKIITGVFIPVLKFLIDALTDVIKVVKDVIDWFKDLGDKASAAGTAISNAWTTAWDTVKTAWGTVRDWLEQEWKDFKTTAGKLWGDIAGAVGDAFGAVKTAVSTVWTGVEKVFATGVNFVTQDILNPLIRILDDVLGVFGVNIHPIPKLTVSAPSASGGASSGGSSNPGGTHKAFAAGGVLPGYTPGVDGIALPMFHFSGGEGILVPEATRALGGPDGIQAINAMFSARVSPPNHFTGGGTVPPGVSKEMQDILNQFTSAGISVPGLSGVINKVKDAIRQGAADVAIAGLKTAEAPVKGILGHGGSPFARTLATGVFNKLNDSVYDFIRGHVKKPKTASGAGGALPTGEHLTLIKEALAAAGLADTAANEAAINTIVTYESGWNPNAINLTDSNAQAGHPSQGLMQTIPSTFEGNRSRSLPDDITDPLSNMVAGIRYAVSRYGSLENVPGVVGVANGSGYVGYDSGGYLPPGITTVFNGTGRPEPVFTAEQFNQIAASNNEPGQYTVIAQFGDETVKAQAHTVYDSRLKDQQRQSRSGVHA